MRGGVSPTQACRDALSRINKYYPKFSGALIAATVSGEYGNLLFLTLPCMIWIHVSVQLQGILVENKLNAVVVIIDRRYIFSFSTPNP